LFTFSMGFKEGLSRGLPPMIMLRTMPYMMPEMLGITIPVAMLYAVCGAFGRMTGANEIVALKSLGISPMAMVWPVVVMAAFFSLGTVWMYELAATWCRPSRNQIICESIEDIAYGVLQKERFCETDQLSITVKRVEGHVLIQPTIVVKPRLSQPKVTITAAEAELFTDWKAGQLRMVCRNGQIDIEGTMPMSMSFSGEQQYTIPLPKSNPDRRHRDWISMKDIPTTIIEITAENENLRRDLRTMKKLHEANKVLGILDSHDGPKKISEKIDDNAFRILRLKTEPFRRWSNGFTCLCFTLIGMPVAMLWRHADVLTNFFLCFLPILSVYYPLLMLSEDLATSGKPPILFWMGNALLFGAATLLLRRVIRH
jgi:lipopolysaccharide export system permease protein